MDHGDALKRILGDETQIFGQEVLAPVIRGGRLRVRIGSFVWECRLTGDFSGWGVFRVLEGWRAELVREAEPWEREEYAAKLKRVSLVLTHLDSSGIWWAGDFRSADLAPVLLVEGMSVFDGVRACFDGACFWFLGPDGESDGRKAAMMRDAFALGVPPPELSIPALRSRERGLYEIAYALDRDAAERRKPLEMRRIEEALRVGDGELVDYAPVNEGYRVTWRKGAELFTSILDRNLAVVSAGLCLSGRDGEQDLTSLASLMAERPREHGG